MLHAGVSWQFTLHLSSALCKTVGFYFHQEWVCTLVGVAQLVGCGLPLQGNVTIQFLLRAHSLPLSLKININLLKSSLF